MRILFVDTSYWVARFNRHDQWHQKARELSSQLGDAQLLTSELVLVECLNYFSAFGAEMRQKVAIAVQNILEAPDIQVTWQTHSLFEAGLTLYRSRLDKGYSLTDCVSMVVMRQEAIQRVLTHDKHFGQEGFTILL
ncbi:type II toxin-antitoxin system VapC family toxin [Egbenema bharatensis]|uniref:type II toxin-antitoxin system VapC family toxin n=1 Tax=Egbenema bharatensis TaxID=3463334 RepID=UPI003A8ABB81